MNKFNEVYSKIIKESVGKNYQCSINHVDVFSSPTFMKGWERSIFFWDKITETILSKINLKNIQEEKEYVVWFPACEYSIIIKIIPENSFRHEFLYETWNHNVTEIPRLTKTGQERIVIE